jgi:hypothetical protein
VNEIQIQAQFTALIAQRDAALNTSVNLAGELAVARNNVADLQAQVATLTAIVDAKKSESEQTEQEPLAIQEI